jgi:hypothetical protein
LIEVLAFVGEQTFGNGKVLDRAGSHSATAALKRAPTTPWKLAIGVTAVVTISSKAAFMP